MECSQESTVAMRRDTSASVFQKWVSCSRKAVTTVVPATEAGLMDAWTVKVPFFKKDFIFMLISITAVADMAGTVLRESQ